MDSSLHSLLKRQLKRHGLETPTLALPMQKFIEAVNDAYGQFDSDRAMLERSLELSSRDLLEANSEMRAVFQAIPDLVLRLNHQGLVLSVTAGAAHNLANPLRALIGKNIQDLSPSELGAQYYAAVQKVIKGEQDVALEYSALVQEQELHFEARLLPLQENEIVVIIRNISSRKTAETRLNDLNRQLIEASRQAGMAEVATGVLHNVGNILNSVNVCASVIREKLRQSQTASVGKLAKLLETHSADLGKFFTEDPKGRMVPGFCKQLAAHLDQENAGLQKEVEQLVRNVDHIKEIVAMQQSYAKLSGVKEVVPIAEVVDDALKMNAESLERRGIQTIRRYSEVPRVLVNRHKVIQILVNLVRNATYALDNSGKAEKKLTLEISLNGNNRVKVAVTDNGIGIPAQNLTRIFSHGFTTRKDGHGFGLHSGANDAREMGGLLQVSSEGAGKGATFSLELPLANEGNSYDTNREFQKSPHSRN